MDSTINIDELDKSVIPILLVAKDLIFNGALVKVGIENYLSVIEYIKQWYSSQLNGHTFRTAQLIVIKSQYTISEWKEFSIATDEHQSNTFKDRHLFWQKADQEIIKDFPYNPKRYKVIATPFIGIEPSIYLGAAANDFLVVCAPRSSSVRLPNQFNPADLLTEVQADSTYALAHELGHTFGLPDLSKETSPKPEFMEESIMYGKKLPHALLLSEEIITVLNSGFIF